MPKRKHAEHEEHENHEAWVIPYADMLTLLMGLFLVMWSISTTDLNKMKQVGAAFASEFGTAPSGTQAGDGPLDGSTTVGHAADVVPTSGIGGVDVLDMAYQEQRRQQGVRKELNQLEAVQKTIQGQVDLAGLTDKITLKLTPEGLLIIATDGLLFASGAAVLEPAGSSALATIAAPLRSMEQLIIILGHTDDRPITGRYPSNWELSTARASSVLRELVERHGFPVARLAASGYADQKPIASNATAEGRAQNRRVEILVAAMTTREQLPVASDGKATVAGAPFLGAPAPIGPDGPLGKPEAIGPQFP